MPLPQITIPNLYPDLFIVSLGISTVFPDGNITQSAEVHLRPYNYSTGQIMPGDAAYPQSLSPTDTVLSISNIYAEAVRVPLFAQTIGYVTQVTGLLILEKQLSSQIASALAINPSADVSALQAQLTTVQTEMGITVS